MKQHRKERRKLSIFTKYAEEANDQFKYDYDDDDDAWPINLER